MPRARRRAIILRPDRVDILLRNPLLRFFLRFDMGLRVNFTISECIVANTRAAVKMIRSAFKKTCYFPSLSPIITVLFVVHNLVDIVRFLL